MELDVRSLEDKELDAVSGGFIRTGSGFYDEPVVYSVQDYNTVWNTVNQLR
jgi:hypothetical protein